MTVTVITRARIADILSLQQHAYELLLWLGDRAREDPELLSVEAEQALADPRSCHAWLRERWHWLPAEHRLAQDAALAALLSSFFRTSFHVQRLEWEGRSVQAELRTGPGHAGSRAKKRARHGGSLEHEALHRLCRDEGLRAPAKTLVRLARAQSSRGDLHVWCYALGLVQRAEGRSEGEGDWVHWRAIPLAERKSLSVDMVWSARERLLAKLGTIVDEGK